ncbi:MAG: hypothetical protein ACREFD_19730 [Stellaceae bacterium]
MATSRELGARRMWIRRRLDSGKINKDEARRMTRELDAMPVTSRSKGRSRGASVRQPADITRERAPIVVPGEPSTLVTIQYDPTKYRVEFHRLRQRR